METTVGAAVASPEGVAAAWAVAGVLAILTLLAVRWKVPGVKGVIKGADGRASTSKFQAAMWTYLVIFALLMLLWAYGLIELLGGGVLQIGWAEELNEKLKEGFSDFIDNGFSESYLLLLGLPLASAVTSKAITATKVDNGTIVKPSKEESEAAGEATTTSKKEELVSDDSGGVDLGDLQYLLFNLVTAGYFLVVFFTDPSAGLPEVPLTLLGLTGVSAATYVGKKAIYQEPPVLLGVLPPAAKPGAEVRVYGERLLSAKAKGVAANAKRKDREKLGSIVTFNGLAATISGSPSDSMVTVVVPEFPTAGPVQVAVTRPPGAASESLPFTVLE